MKLGEAVMKETKFIDAGLDFRNQHFNGEVVIGCMKMVFEIPNKLL